MSSRTDTRSDLELVTAARAGHAPAFGALVARYQALACAVACSATRDVDSAEDLAQEAFVIAWARLGELRDPDRFRPWLAGIVRNVARYWRRQQSRHAPGAAASPSELEAIAAPEPSPLEQAEQRQQLSIAADALRSLPDRYREPLLLYHALDESYAEVASCLGLREATVRQRVHRARAKLRDQVGAVESMAAKCGRRAGAAAAVLAILNARRAWAQPIPAAPMSPPLLFALGSAGALAIVVCAVASTLLLGSQRAASAASIMTADAVRAFTTPMPALVIDAPVHAPVIQSSATTTSDLDSTSGVVVLGRGRVHEPGVDSDSVVAAGPVADGHSSGDDRVRGSRIAHGPAILHARRSPVMGDEGPVAEQPLLHPSISFGDVQRELYGE